MSDQNGKSICLTVKAVALMRSGPPMSRADLCRALGVEPNRDSVKFYLQAMHDNEHLIHIKFWRGANQPVYAWGDLPDALPPVKQRSPR